MTTSLLIKSCSDPSMWYAGLVGETVPLLFTERDCYISRQPEGYVNIVHLEDGEVVEDESVGTDVQSG